MKKLSFILLVTISITAGCSFSGLEKTTGDAFYRGLKSTDEFMAFSVPVRMAYLVIPRHEKEARALLKDVHNIGVLVLRNGEKSEDNLKLAAAMNASFTRQGYLDYMTIHDSGNKIHVNVMEDSGRIRELLLVVASPEEFVFIKIKGNISLQNFVNFANNYQASL